MPKFQPIYLPPVTGQVERADLAELLPEGITWRLKQGLLGFEKQFRGYPTEEALMVGFETRTSSPLRIPRDPESLQHPDVKGLYPLWRGSWFWLAES